MNSKFDNTFFNTMLNGTEKFENLTWDTLTTNSELKSKGEIELRIGGNLSNVQYINLKSGYKIARKKYHKEGEKTVTLESFVLNTTKGSKRFRHILPKMLKGKKAGKFKT